MKEKQNCKLCTALKAIQQHVSMGTHQLTSGRQCFGSVSQFWNPDANECECMFIAVLLLVHSLHPPCYRKLTLPPQRIAEWLWQLNEPERWDWAAAGVFGFTITYHPTANQVLPQPPSYKNDFCEEYGINQTTKLIQVRENNEKRMTTVPLTFHLLTVLLTAEHNHTFAELCWLSVHCKRVNTVKRYCHEVPIPWNFTMVKNRVVNSADLKLSLHKELYFIEAMDINHARKWKEDKGAEKYKWNKRTYLGTPVISGWILRYSSKLHSDSGK